MRTKKNLKTNLELRQTLNPCYQCYPFIKDKAAGSQGPAASDNSEDKDSEHRDEYSARSQDSGRTVLYPDPCVLTNDEHGTVTPRTHKYAAAAGTFCFVTTENGEQHNVCNLITMPCVQRSLYLDEVTNNSGSTQFDVSKGVDSRTRDMLERCMATCGKAAGARAKMRSRARNKHQLRKYEDTVNSLLKKNISSTNPELTTRFLNIMDTRKIMTRNYVTGTMGAQPSRRTNTAKAKWVLRGFLDKQKERQQTDFPCFHKTPISDELANGSQQRLEHFSH